MLVGRRAEKVGEEVIFHLGPTVDIDEANNLHETYNKQHPAGNKGVG